MRISSVLAAGALLAFGFVASASGVFASDVRPGAPADSIESSSVRAYLAGTRLLKAGDMDKGLQELRSAAEQGHPLAQWRLARMYADGEGVKRDDFQAFQYFSRIASEHAEASPWMQHARFVANAYVSLGTYYLAGIPNTQVRRDEHRAYNLISYAASYFGDPDAQYLLGRLFIEGTGTDKDMRQGVRWLNLAAQKGQHQAQALLGRMLFHGEGIPRQRAQGLMWLTLGRDAAAGAEDGWIVESYEDATARASEDERLSSHKLIENWTRQQQRR